MTLQRLTEDKLKRSFTSSISSCAITLGFALCLSFAGFWISDNALLQITNIPRGSFLIRLSSLIIYLLAVIAVWHHNSSAKPNEHTTILIRRACRILFALSGICYIIGIGIAGAGIANNSEVCSYLCLFFSKIIGAPLSILLLLEFSTLPNKAILPTSTIAIACSFFIYGIAAALADSLSISPRIQLIVSTFCILISSLIAVTSAPKLLLEPLHQVSNKESFIHVQALKTSAILCIIVTSMLFGFMRSMMPTNTISNIVASVLILIVFAITLRIKKPIGLNAYFCGAILFALSGFLLEPLFETVTLHGTRLLLTIGTVLFEGFTWIAATMVTHASNNELRTSAVMRFFVVAGHFAGTCIAEAAQSLTATFPQAILASKMGIIFLFVAMLVFIVYRSPKLTFFLFGEADNGPTSGKKAGDETTPAETTAIQVGEHSSTLLTPKDQNYWNVPLHAISQRYGLTPREEEIAKQLAQGRDINFIENTFVISRNTVKMHIRNIYAKLNVHSKQEVINMVRDERQRSEKTP